MNGHDLSQPPMTEDRQPPTIPSLGSLAINRPPSAASPNPSQLPPLTNHYTPSFTQRPVQRDGPQTTHTPASSFPADNKTTTNKTATLAHIAPSQPIGGPIGGPQPHSFNGYLPPYSSAQHQSFQGPPPTATATPNSHGGHVYITPHPQQQQQQQQQQGLPPFVEPGHQTNLLPPFNPQPPQQPPHAGNASGADPRPFPVVGSQGRRGILPSAPGRLPPSGVGMESRAALSNATRGLDGKYACQFCSKVYLHLKHLKRHHLRHTGERPYQCYLCQETFCRSDILKRHFHKCSIRRGNPTGATHLTHAQAHLRRGSLTPGSSISGSTAQNGPPSTHPSAPPSSYRPNFSHVASGQEPGDSTRSSRSSSVVQRPGSGSDDRKSFHSGPGPAPQTGNTSLNTSPSSAVGVGEERKYGPAQYSSFNNRELPGFHEAGPSPSQQPPPPPYQGYYSSAPPQFAATSQPEQFQALGYGQTNGYRYPPPQEGPHYPDQQHWHQYSQFFQPGSHDPVMSYHQQ